MFHYGYASIFNEISELDTQYTRYSSLSIAKVNQELIETVNLFTWVIRLNRVYGSNIRSARFVCTAQPTPGSPVYKYNKNKKSKASTTIIQPVVRSFASLT